MKRKSLTFIFSVLVLMLALPASGRDLKVLYWNIQNGMWADQENNYDNFVEYVKSQDPDICVWCEAESRYRTGTNVKMTEYDEFYLPWNWDFLARRYGHQYVLVCGKRDTFPQVITSKYPVRIVKRVNGNGDDIIVVHGAGWAQVEVGGKEINIVTPHTWLLCKILIGGRKPNMTEQLKKLVYKESSKQSKIVYQGNKAQVSSEKKWITNILHRVTRRIRAVNMFKHRPLQHIRHLQAICIKLP